MVPLDSRRIAFDFPGAPDKVASDCVSVQMSKDSYSNHNVEYIYFIAQIQTNRLMV